MQPDPAFDPENRELYTAMMRAPDGYRFEHAVATTYSLDFETALAIPIAIVFRDAENRDEMLRSPLALLQSVERMAERIAIYCDRGRIKSANPNASRLMALYEKSIVEVSAPGGGAFHPKLWCIRFQPEKRGAPVRMRLAILSRNLTNDRCWDLALCLDGTVDYAEINSANLPITELLRALPGLANRSTRPAEPAFLRALVRDLQHCWWSDLPAGATRISFAVNGLGAKRWEPKKGERIAILSPFVSNEALKWLADGYAEPGASQLIARPEELDCLNPRVRSLFQVQTLDSRASEFEEGDEVAADTGNLEGLHAKAYVVERGSRLHIHLGSANATVAALFPTKSGRTQNVEVMAELDGPKTRMGTIEQALFAEGFKRLLIPYEPSEAPIEDSRLAAEKLLDRTRRQIAAVPLDLHCTELGDLVGLEVGVAGAGPAVELPDGVTCFIRPITVANLRGHDAAALFQAGVPLSVGQLPLGDITRWLGVRLHHQPTNMDCSFTLGARLIDLPAGRDAAVLSAQIANAGNFFRYLSLLLGSLGEGSFLESETAGEGQWLQRFGQGGSSLLEPMVRALNMGGDELREIDALLRRLDSPAGDGNIVPEEFRELWASFAPLLESSKARR